LGKKQNLIIITVAAVETKLDPCLNTLNIVPNGQAKEKVKKKRHLKIL
jgi:hypothetical protein